jgi:hypothetical protein
LDREELKRLQENYPREPCSDVESIGGSNARTSNRRPFVRRGSNLSVSSTNVSSIRERGNNINVNRNVNSSIIREELKELKVKIFWYCWKQFSNDFNNYKEFTGSLNSNFSVRKEIKKDVFGKFKK